MKENMIRGALALVISLILSTTYLNCGGNMQPVSQDTNDQNLSSTSGVCPNGAIDYPKCKLNFFQKCIDGSTNPPDCTTGSTDPQQTCTNEATNPPACTLNTEGACLIGATNPPECTQLPSCDNGALDYPTCTSFTSAGQFDVVATKSGPLSAFNIEIKMDFNEADKTKKGALFIVAQSDKKTFVCTNPCSGNTWKEWTGDNAVDWSISGIRDQVGISTTGLSGLQTILKNKFDITSLGGYVVYAGYGVGDSVFSAINEMLSYRSSALPTGRFIDAFTVPVQKLSVSLTGPSGGPAGPVTNLDLWAQISPSSADYGKPGYYFVMAKNPDDTIKLMYGYNSSTSKYEWSNWDGNVASITSNMAYKSDSSIKNEFFQVVKGNVSDYKGWYVYAGYGNGATISEAANDCLTNNKFNLTPFIVPSN